MPIWLNTPSVESANQLAENTLASHLGIRVTHIGDDFIVGTLPINQRTLQNHGALDSALHGGATTALAETLVGYGANCCVDQSQYQCIGLAINANHIQPARSGKVTAMARPIHLGKSTHVWRVEINDENDQVICESRLTLAVVNLAES